MFEAPGITDAGVMLAEINQGKLRDELSQSITKTIFALHERSSATCGKSKGKVTLALSFVVEESGALTIEGDVTSKLPAPLRGKDHFFVGKGGSITRKNPRQQELPLREVPGTHAHAAREAQAEKGA